MSHVNQQLIDAVAVVLDAAATSWKFVFKTRLPTSRAVMPYLMLFVADESVAAIETMGPGIYLRDVGLVVAGRLRLPGNNDTETVEERMNTLAADVETRLTFAALQAELPQLQSLRLTGSERTVVINEDDAPQYAEITLSLVARFATQEGAPSVFL